MAAKRTRTASRDMYLHQAKMPHSPVRSEASIGLVIERKEPERFTDGLLWYCDNCNHKLHEVYFELNNIEKISFLISNISTNLN
jgi:3-hydroxyanthranilate 3,4-dioxygenase